MEHQTPKTKLYLVGRKRPFYLVDDLETIDGQVFDHHPVKVTQTDGVKMLVPYERIQSVVEISMPEVPEPDEPKTMLDYSKDPEGEERTDEDVARREDAETAWPDDMDRPEADAALSA